MSTLKPFPPGDATANSTKEILESMGYSIHRKLGKGTYSKVCIATLKNEIGKKICACKIIDIKNSERQFVKRFLPREIKIVGKLEHPHIVNVFDIIEIKQQIFMFMDYCKNGDLLEFIHINGALTENKSKFYFRQLASAVLYIHDLDIAHRDLKCENIFLTANLSVKVGDFGFARSCKDELTGKKILSNTFCGSAAYAAPEILQGISYDPKMYDIWALGCVLYIMLSAAMPFDDSNVKEMLKAQLNGAACMVIFRTSHSLSLKTLIRRLLEPKLEKRATIQQVTKCAWFKKLVKSSSDTAITAKLKK